MKKFSGAALTVGFLWIILGNCGCTSATDRVPTAEKIDITQAYQTVDFHLTQAQNTAMNISVPPVATVTVTQSPPSTPGQIDLPTPSPTQSPTDPPPTPTLVCDQAAAGNPIDVTIPDDTELMPGQSFTKIWRLQNTGTCTWTPDYAVRFFYGAQMSAPESISLHQAVVPGETVEIAVDMVAPLSSGIQQGNWKLRNAAGQLFGIGPNGDAPFWVRILVLKPFTSTPTPSLTSTVTPSTTPTSTQTPTVTPTATPTVILQVRGNLSMVPTVTLNLDNGEVNPSTGKDLAYQIDANNLHLLVPQDTAILGVYGVTEPTQSACQNAAMSKAGLALESLPIGTYLCYRTDQGLSGWLRYVSLIVADNSVNIEYQTWGPPSP